MSKEIKQRFVRVKLYLETGNAGFVCSRCGISRPTLRKWVRRYKGTGIQGLKDLSRRPNTLLKGKYLRRTRVNINAEKTKKAQSKKASK